MATVIVDLVSLQPPRKKRLFRKQIVIKRTSENLSEYRQFENFYIVGLDAPDSAARFGSADHSIT
jgi:hypothetical protein